MVKVGPASESKFRIGVPDGACEFLLYLAAFLRAYMTQHGDRMATRDFTLIQKCSIKLDFFVVTATTPRLQSIDWMDQGECSDIVGRIYQQSSPWLADMRSGPVVLNPRDISVVDIVKIDTWTDTLIACVYSYVLMERGFSVKPKRSGSIIW